MAVWSIQVINICATSHTSKDDSTKRAAGSCYSQGYQVYDLKGVSKNRTLNYWQRCQPAAYTLRAMAHINKGVVDNNEISYHDDDPRAYPFPFGQFAGKRLDTVSNGLRRWATRAHLARNSWYPAYIKANKRYEELLLQTPEAYPFPFGEHEDERLDEVPEDLIWWSIHPSRSGNAWHQNLAEANRLYLDKVYDQKSPGSVAIWFGERYKGYRLDDVYKRPGFIRFCLKPEHNKCPWTHRRPYHPRAPAHVENPTGQLLGKWDDGRGSVEPDDDYERDDFVVDDDDDEKEIYQEIGSDFQLNNTNELAVDDDSDDEDHANSESTENSDTDRPAAQAEGLSPSHASADISQTSGFDSDDDIPLDELRKKTVIKHLSDGKVTSSNNRRRICQSSSGEETDTADQPPPKRLRRKSEHEGADSLSESSPTDSHSDAESAALDETETPHRYQLSQSLSALSLSQESARSPNNDDELPRVPRTYVRRESGNDDSDIPEYDTHTNTPSRLGRRYHALIQSDVEESKHQDVEYLDHRWPTRLLILKGPSAQATKDAQCQARFGWQPGSDYKIGNTIINRIKDVQS
ncbi:hypothetical protein BDR05DRAFT_1046447 [Suillus weaverae]|nr:hypothetical protein BDR05DRAFT_1046447 [Suillus weaverae]